jgi:hypothetical protein
MIRPKLSKVASGTRLTTDLVNDIINRTEYAADLLRQYKLVAGTEMYVEPHFDGTRVSYFYPVGGGATPNDSAVVRPFVSNYKIIEHTVGLTLVNGGPSFVNGIIKLQRYRGTGTNNDPIVPLTWKTPSDYTLRLFSGPFGNSIIEVNQEIINYQLQSIDLALYNPSSVGNIFATLLKGSSTVSFLGSNSLDYTFSPSLVLSSFNYPIDQPDARVSFSYSAFPLVDFYPVTMEVSITSGTAGIPPGVITTIESFTINSPSSFLSTGTYTSNATFDTILLRLFPVRIFATVYFARDPIFPFVYTVYPN